MSITRDRRVPPRRQRPQRCRCAPRNCGPGSRFRSNKPWCGFSANWFNVASSTPKARRWPMNPA